MNIRDIVDLIVYTFYLDKYKQEYIHAASLHLFTISCAQTEKCPSQNLAGTNFGQGIGNGIAIKFNFKYILLYNYIISPGISIIVKRCLLLMKINEFKFSFF